MPNTATTTSTQDMTRRLMPGRPDRGGQTTYAMVPRTGIEYRRARRTGGVGGAAVRRLRGAPDRGRLGRGFRSSVIGQALLRVVLNVLTTGEDARQLLSVHHDSFPGARMPSSARDFCRHRRARD